MPSAYQCLLVRSTIGRGQALGAEVRHVEGPRCPHGQLPVEHGERAAVGQVEEQVVEPQIGVCDREWRGRHRDVVHLRKLLAPAPRDVHGGACPAPVVLLDEHGEDLLVGRLTRLVGRVVEWSQPWHRIELGAVPPVGVEQRDRVHDPLGHLKRAPRDLVKGPTPAEIFEKQDDGVAALGHIDVEAVGETDANIPMGDIAVEAGLGQVEPVGRDKLDRFLEVRPDLCHQCRSIAEGDTGDHTEDAHALTDSFDGARSDFAAKNAAQPGVSYVVQHPRNRRSPHVRKVVAGARGGSGSRR